MQKFVSLRNIFCDMSGNNLHIRNVKLQSNIRYESANVKGNATATMLNLPFLMHASHSFCVGELVPSSKYNLRQVENGVAAMCY
jgi:hypothetical protein